MRKLIDQEVSFAVKRHETKLRGLIETIQHLDHKIDYESSIQKLEVSGNKYGNTIKGQLMSYFQQ